MLMSTLYTLQWASIEGVDRMAGTVGFKVILIVCVVCDLLLVVRMVCHVARIQFTDTELLHTRAVRHSPPHLQMTTLPMTDH